ncbi:MAG TPA: hypothetical protein VG963_34340, partial [Polyangiaceae bacterium]|nr:hypothetical protein [Polyangiaceae bacterium]
SRIPSLLLALLPLGCGHDETQLNGVMSPPDMGSAGTGSSASDSSSGTANGSAGTDSSGAPMNADTSTAFDGSCATLPGTIVYVESGDTQENLLKRLGRHLRDYADVTLAFNLTGSCTLTSDIYSGSHVVKSGTLKYIPSTLEDPNWTPAMAEPTCTTGPEGVPVDVAISALFVQSCDLGEPPADSGLALIQGPIQAYTFVVPSASDQSAIWAEEGYYAFGFGSRNPLAPQYDPWDDEAFMFIRPPTKSTLVATAKNIRVPPNQWKGVPEAASNDVVTAVTTSANAEATIGILGAEVYDASRDQGMKTLAFQAFGQSAAYYPDSTATAFDKQNLRDGHYGLWSPTVYITKVDSANVPVNPTVHYLTDLVLGNEPSTPPAGAAHFDALADVVKVGLIPECAMKVQRSEDGGDLSPLVPSEPCDCYYASLIPGASGTPAGCTVCSSAADCGGGQCNHGFCEPSEMAAPSGSSPSGCFAGTPSTHTEIIDTCTNSDHVTKAVTLPGPELEPLP